MSKRIPKRIAQELIQYVKTIQVVASYQDPASKSAYEFARQMQSPSLLKVNPSLSVVVDNPSATPPPNPRIRVEYNDGSVWEEDTSGYKLPQLRSMFYEKAEEAEEQSMQRGK